MLQISRELHCALADMEVGAFKTLQQYGRLPMLPAALRADKPFGPFETFVLATFNTMVEYHRVARERAADICSAGAENLAARWPELAETVAERRFANKDELLFGRVDLAGTLKQGGGPKPVIGTFEEIAAQHATAISITAISITRVANLVRDRAAERGIDIKQFWAEPFPAVPAKKTRSQKKGPSR
jgi:hypothetical protein